MALSGVRRSSSVVRYLFHICYLFHIWCKCSSCSWIVPPRYWWRPLSQKIMAQKPNFYIFDFFSETTSRLHTSSPWVCVTKVCSNGGATYIIGEIITKDNLNTENLMQTFENLLLQNCSQNS